MSFFKKEKLYPIEKLSMIKPHIGSCRYCSCPVMFAPVIKVMVTHFKVIAFKLIDSHENDHHCFAYKIEQPIEIKEKEKEA